MVQQRAARWTLNRYHNTSSVTSMLSHLGWPSLQTRRAEARMCLMYKMVHHQVATDISLYTNSTVCQTHKTHPFSFVQISARSEAYRMSYFPRTIIQWNLLPIGVVTAPSLEAFKARLTGMRVIPN